MEFTLSTSRPTEAGLLAPTDDAPEAKIGERGVAASNSAGHPVLKPRAPQVLRSAQEPAQLCFQFSRV